MYGKPEPIVLLVLPIIPSRISLYLFPYQHLLFLYHSQHFIVLVIMVPALWWYAVYIVAD